LLEEAGLSNLAFTLSVPDSPIEVAHAETLQEDAREAGVDITIDRMPDNDYWTVWTTTPVGITTWQPRTLALTVLRLAYTADASGQPADWNESRWVDEEFSDLLAKAELTRDLEARRAIMADLQRIQSERGSIGIAYWTNAHFVVNAAFNNIKERATGALLLTEAWYDPDSDPFA
jgi:peptide/nickel transport system substrate-binding protein